MTQAAEPIVFEAVDAVTARLSELGLDQAMLHEAILDGEAARESCTIHDPRSLPGIFGWARTVRGLRDRLVPLGWTAREDRNYPTTVSPDGTIAIAVATGTDGTGVRAGTAGAKYSKGPATVFAIERNQQLALQFPGWPAEVQHRPPEGNGPVTWLLLVRSGGDVIVAELSRPTDIDDEGTNIVFAERILLGEIPVGSGPVVDQIESDEINIEIERVTG